MYGHTYLMSNIIDQLVQFENIVSQREVDRERYLDRDLDSDSEDNGHGIQALY